MFGCFFSRLSSLIARSSGQILYKGGELNRSDLFIPPIIIAVSADDVLMEDEVRIFLFSFLSLSLE